MNIPHQHRFAFVLALLGFAMAFVFVVVRSGEQVASIGSQSQLAAVDASDTHLIGWWKLDDNAANTTVADSSSAGHTGTASVNTSSLSTSGKIGGAFNFAAGQSVDTGYTWQSGDTDYTVSVWFKTTAVSQVFFSSYNGQKGNISGVLDNSGRPECQAVDVTGHFVYTIQNKPYSDGAWHQIACVMSAGTLTMYMDSVNVNQATGGGGDYRGVSPRTILIGTTGPEAIDDVRIYTRALQASEVSQLYTDAGGTAPSSGSTGTTGTTGTTQQTQTTQTTTTQPTQTPPAQTQTSALPAPTNATATAISSNQINISWSPVSGAASYKVYRNSSAIGTATSLSFSSINLNPATTYGYTVAAVDSAGNVSTNQSTNVSATTLTSGAQPTGYQLTVGTYQHAGQGIVTATVNGQQIINCGSDCTEILPAGAAITLTAVPASGSSLARWEDCPGASGNTCTITMPNWNMSIGAFFTSPFTPKTSLSSLIHDGMTWVFTGDSFTTLFTYTDYIESYFELRNPTMHLHFRNAARSGAALADLMDDPTINPHIDPTTGAAVGYANDSRFDMEVYGWYPDVVSVDFSDNGHPTGAQLAASTSEFITKYIIPNHSTPVILGFWPMNSLSLLTEGTYMETLSDAVGQMGNSMGVLTGMIWHDMAPMMIANLNSPSPVNLDGLANNTDIEHLNEAGTLAAATNALRELGADGDVSDVTIDASAGTVASATHATITGMAKNSSSGVDFTRLDARLPMAFDDLSRPVIAISPQVLDMNRYMLTVNNLSAGTYDIYIDGVKSATVDSNTLASGWNMTTMTQGPIHDQLVNVGNLIRDKEGASRTRLYPPVIETQTGNPCAGPGNWWGVAGYNSNSGIYDSTGLRGDALVAQLTAAKNMTNCFDNLIYAAVQPVARAFSIRKVSNSVATDTTPPVVSLISPVSGVTVTGNAVLINASAFDDIGVVGVQFKVDGVNIGAEDTVSPYSINWDSTKATAGTHSLTAVARDAAGNTTTSSAVTVTVSNNVNNAPSTAFKIGDRVNPTQDLTNVRSSPAGAVINTQDMISSGTVIGGPTAAILAGVSYSWWDIDFDTGDDGWVAEPFLVKSNTTAPATTTPSVAMTITGIASSTSATSATIIWTTSVNADSQVEYGQTAAYGSFSAQDTTPVQSHSQTITGLTPNTVYHFRVRSSASGGAVSSSTDMTFTTTAQAQQGPISIGSRVQVTADATNAYFMKLGPILGALQGVWNTGEKGFITQGPKTVGGVTYWDVNFDASKAVSTGNPRSDGWVDATRLAPYTTTSTVAPVGNNRTVNMYAGIAQQFSVDADDPAGDAITIDYPQNTAHGGRLILTSNLPVTQASTSKEFNFIYVPVSGVSSDSFQYTLTDGVNTSAPYTVTFNIQPVTSSTWIPPIGVPRPEFGIDDTYRMYDAPANRNPNLTYNASASGGYYTHYVDGSGACVNTGTGSPSAPLCTIPAILPAGSVVEVHGTEKANESQVNSYQGTIKQPIFVRGVGMPRMAATDESKNWVLSNNQLTNPAGGGQYIIVEGISFYFFGVGRRYSHVVFRDNDVSGDQNGGGLTVADSDTNYPIMDNVVFLRNKVHDIGIWDPNVTAALCAAGTLDSTGQTYCDRDHAAIVFAWGSLAENIWVLDSDLSTSEGDSVQVNAGGQGVPLNQNLHHVYIGRNEMYKNKQSSFASKALHSLVVTQNDMWGIATSSSANGAAIDFSDDGPQDAWFLFNRIHDSEIAIKPNGGSGTGPFYFIGNLIYDIHNPYSSAPLSGNYAQAGQAIADWHTAAPQYFINNTIYDMDFGLGAWTYGWTANSAIKFSNNIVAKATTGQMIFNQGDSFFSVNNNLFQGSTTDNALSIYWRGSAPTTVAAFETAAGSMASGNKSGNPLFVDPANGNFNLQSGSPAIDSGDSSLMSQVASLFYTEFGSDIRKDFNGNNRPSGGAYDIGAIEYGATGGNQPPPAVIATQPTNPPVVPPPVTTPPPNPTPTPPTDSDSDGVADTSDACASTPAGRAVNSVGCPLPVSSNFTVTAGTPPTALTNINLNSVSNLAISNSQGKITWTSPVSLVHNGDRIDLNANVSIAHGTITVNSAVVPELNHPATITFYNVNLSSLSALKILRDGAICPSCTGATYSNGTLTFNVAGFSTYSILDDSSSGSGDTTPPSVSITTPTDGATITGSASPVIVSADDDTGVVGVQLKIDGANLNNELLNNTFTATFDTNSVSNGSHTLLAVARDAAGNMTTSSPVTVAVLNAPDQSSGGTSGSSGGSDTSSGSSGGSGPVSSGGGGGGGGGSPVSSGGGGGGGGYTIPTTPTALTISNVSVFGTAASGVTISWNTSSSATTQIQYGLTPAYGLLTSLDPTFVLSHTVKLPSNLLAATLYHFQVRSRDSLGNLATSNDLTFYVTPSGSAALATPAGSTVNTPSTNIPAFTPSSNPSPFSPAASITAWLVLGTTNSQVKSLQQLLNANGFAVASSGTGSKGSETSYFGPATLAALERFQCAKLQVCSGSSDTTGYGATGPRTRAALSALGGGIAQSPTASNIPVSAPSPSPSPLSPSASITTWLVLGTTNSQVATLQKILNAAGFTVAVSGAGSPGNESAHFGALTQAALERFQCAKINVCSGSSDTTGYGATGPRTRAALNQI